MALAKFLAINIALSTLIVLSGHTLSYLFG